MIFLRRAHTVTVLLIMLCVLVYVGAFEKTKENSEYNTKRYEYFYRKNGRDHKYSLTLYTLKSVSIFSLLFPKHFLRCCQGEFI